MCCGIISTFINVGIECKVLVFCVNPTKTGGGGQRARSCILCYIFRKRFARLTWNFLTFPKYYIGSIWQKKIHIATCHVVTAFLCHDVIKKFPPFWFFSFGFWSRIYQRSIVESLKSNCSRLKNWRWGVQRPPPPPTVI